MLNLCSCEVEVLLLLKLWTETKWVHPSSCLAWVGKSWPFEECDSRRLPEPSLTNRPNDSLAMQARTTPFCGSSPNLTAMHQLEPGCWQHHFFTVQWLWKQLYFRPCTHTITCTHCLTKDSIGQFFCTDYWHCISTYCGTQSLWIWPLSAKGPDIRLKLLLSNHCCRNFSSVCCGL